MKNINDPHVKSEIISRIKKLEPTAKGLWGKMNVHQAVCHLSDQMRDLHGMRPVQYEGNFITRWIVRPLISRLSKWPEGAFPASPKYDQQKEGTAPVIFEKDKEELLRLFDKLRLDEEKLLMHPAFGKLNAHQYARIVYQHFDHHLRQFGV
jgi:hypothetical protein